MLTDVRDIVRRIVAEYGDAIKGAVVFWEVHPAFFGQLLLGLALEAKANDVGCGIEEPFFCQGHQLDLAGDLDQLREGNRGYQMVVLIAGSILGGAGLCLQINVDYLAAEFQLVLGQLTCAGFPDGTSSTTLRELEGIVRPPGDIIRFVDKVFQNATEIGHRDAFSHPHRVHQLWRVCPHLEVVGLHKDIRQAGPECGMDPLLKICRVRQGALRDLEQALEALVEVILRKTMNIVLEGVGNEAIANPDPGFTLMMQPAILSQEGDHGIIEVLVMGELDMAADIPSEALFVDK